MFLLMKDEKILNHRIDLRNVTQRTKTQSHFDSIEI